MILQSLNINNEVIYIKDIKGYEGFYKVTNDGKIFSIRNNKFLRLNYKKNGYVYVELNVHGQAKTHRVHRLVAEAFIPNYENKPFVNHINCIKSDNRVDNLEWCTVSENTQHAWDNGLISSPTHNYNIIKDDVIIHRVSGLSEVIKLVGYSSSTVCGYIKSNKPLLNGNYKGCRIVKSM